MFLHFAGTIRSVLGSAEATVSGSVQLARVAYAGAITGITGITMAIVMIAAAATEGADANPVVSRAVTTAAAGPYFVAAMGFAVMLAAAGLLTLRTGVFARWMGIVALLGALSFVITFFALIQGTSEDSVFGFGFLPGILALAIWSIATSTLRTALWGRLSASFGRPPPARAPRPKEEWPLGTATQMKLEKLETDVLPGIEARLVPFSGICSSIRR